VSRAPPAIISSAVATIGRFGSLSEGASTDPNAHEIDANTSTPALARSTVPPPSPEP
jgi:hypothetical protein